MYALLISVPIINCVNDQRKWIWLFVSMGGEICPQLWEAWSLELAPSLHMEWTCESCAVLCQVWFLSLLTAVHLGRCESVCSEQGRSGLCFWSLASGRVVASTHWECILHQPTLLQVHGHYFSSSSELHKVGINIFIFKNQCLACLFFSKAAIRDSGKFTWGLFCLKKFPCVSPLCFPPVRKMRDEIC